MSSGYGPDCPSCGVSAEWTQSDIDEVVYAPKTFCCSKCYHFYVLDIEEIATLQKAARALLSQHEVRAETEDDWRKAREQWDKHD